MLGSRVSPGFLGKAACVTIALVIIVVACGSSGNTSADVYVPTATSSDELVSMMRYMGMGYDYEPHDSPASLANTAALTVIGTIIDIADGRVFGVGETRDVEPVFLKLTYTVKVEKVLEGDESLIRNGLVYVEIFRTKYLTVKSFQDATPKNQRLLLFLSDYTRGFTSGTFKLIEKSPSIPDGAPVLAPYTEGFLIEDVSTGRLIGGLEDLRLLSTAWNEGINSIDNFTATHFAGNELIE